MRSVNSKNIIAIALGLGFCILSIVHASAQEDGLRVKEYNLDTDNVALQGYDVVSYFMGAPLKGKKSVVYNYNGINYWFNNPDNLDLFKKQPNKFEPAYGGWCAYAMGDTGEKVKIDPKSYKLIDGKLYLFYNFYFNNTLIDWNKDEDRLIINADAHWSKIINIP